ncbi:hypothetical protein OYT13_19820 [Pandoraea sp. XJJ-1]|uniref:hypothetical protein n=1 Tax=Pandoraea sp. XJJ-1 TaxID=3002643 RepID=UPI0022814D1E|nr:hypothetical protein [Pandoraea sp. XJJ-1]WAL82036.1 hypothetical protein OYT13_19820 [Pandoraea sp. XJJ-1]
MAFLLRSSNCGSFLGIRVKKKPPGCLAVFQDSFRCLLLQLPLSFRQRCENRKKIKVRRMGGHERCVQHCIARICRALESLYTPNRMTPQPQGPLIGWKKRGFYVFQGVKLHQIIVFIEKHAKTPGLSRALCYA